MSAQHWQMKKKIKNQCFIQTEQSEGNVHLQTANEN